MNPNIPGAIRIAVGDGDVDAVRSWLADGGDAFVNETFLQGGSYSLSSPMALATRFRANEGSAMAQLLLDFGARLEIHFLINAIGSDNMETVRLLLARGVDVQGRYGSWTPLHYATLAGELGPWTRAHQGECFRILLEAGASVHARKDDTLETSLMLAAGQGFTSPDVLQLLLKYGSDVNAVDAEGCTAEDHARAALGYPIGAPTLGADRRGPGVVEGSLALLRDYRAAGGTWKRYVAEPRKQLLVLRRLVERGRALPPRIWMRGWTSLARALIGREPSGDGAKAVHDLVGRKDLPDVLFWKVLAFWRSDRDV